MRMLTRCKQLKAKCVGKTNFELQTEKPEIYLYHRSNLGEFFLSSDTITHTYSKWKRLSHIIEKVSSSEIKSFWWIEYHVCSS